MKKTISVLLVAVFAMGALAGCGNKNSNITVISREDGSGTRGAFIELFGVEEKDSSGNKVDKTLDSAEITNNTSVMMTTVAGNDNAIGYISLGSLNDTVKAAKIDGVEPTVANIKNKTYTVVRPFNIATKSKVNEQTQDFIDYIMSKEGQAVVEGKGYIPMDNAKAFSGGKTSGKIVIAGSSSVTPVMEALKEAYLKVNSKVTIEVQQSDSSTGMTSAIDGVCDIGMASRELKDTEVAKGLKSTTIAQDGIAVIVNKNNSTDNLTKEQVKNIFTGSVKAWSEIKG